MTVPQNQAKYAGQVLLVRQTVRVHRLISAEEFPIAAENKVKRSTPRPGSGMHLPTGDWNRSFAELSALVKVILGFFRPGFHKPLRMTMGTRPKSTPGAIGLLILVCAVVVLVFGYEHLERKPRDDRIAKARETVAKLEALAEKDPVKAWEIAKQHHLAGNIEKRNLWTEKAAE